MFGLIPYFYIPLLELGPLKLDSWAILVSLGFIFGLEVGRARAIRLNLEVKDIVDGALFIVGMGFVVAHFVHVLAYNPHQLQEQGIMALLRIWAGFSSYGGFLGAIIGTVLFFRVIRPRPFWLHADTVVYGFPFGWFLGRMGCFSAHDHIGQRSDFFLAVDFPGGARHDLGLYEALWMIVVCFVFYLLRNRKFQPGFFTALFAMMYAPIRFLLDFLRNTDLQGADARYLGLTPAQYGSILMFLGGMGVIAYLQRKDEATLIDPNNPPPPRGAEDAEKPHAPEARDDAEKADVEGGD
ncbi:MAG: prolipoprotein diacylglyceryl transferase family protein [Myxococcota bacterium]